MRERFSPLTRRWLRRFRPKSIQPSLSIRICLRTAPNSSSRGRSDASIFPPVIILSSWSCGVRSARSCRVHAVEFPTGSSVRLTESRLKSHSRRGGHAVKLMKLKVRKHSLIFAFKSAKPPRRLVFFSHHASPANWERRVDVSFQSALQSTTLIFVSIIVYKIIQIVFAFFPWARQVHLSLLNFNYAQRR